MAPCHPWGARFNPMPMQCGDFRFVTLPDVKFASNAAELSDAAKRDLDVAVHYLREDASLRRVLIRGHTDEKGSAGNNEALAARRAAAVRNYLVSRGVPAELLWLRTMGETEPEDQNWTPDGRARNRRVELQAIHWTNTLP